MTYDLSLIRLLKCFIKDDSLSFTEVATRLGFDTDLSGYYLRKLQSKGLLEKKSRGQYQLTPSGKSMLARQRLLKYAVTPRLILLVIAKVDDKFIVLERTKQPFIGKIEWPVLSPNPGQPLDQTATQALQDRLGVEGKPVLVGFFRRIDVHKNEIFDDKLFAVHTVSLDSSQNTFSRNEAGLIHLKSEEEINLLDNRAKSLIDILEFSRSSKSYAEYRYELLNNDLYDRQTTS